MLYVTSSQVRQMEQTPFKKYGWSIFYLFSVGGYALIYSGWLFPYPASPLSQSPGWAHSVFLVGMALPFLIPFVIHRYVKHVGGRGLLFALIPAAVLLLLIYFFWSTIYYHRQRHPFDPFLQISNTRFHVPRQKDKNVFRILCLGGSATLDDRLPEENRYPNVLQKILQSRYPSQQIEVLNDGMHWFTTKHSLINYVTYSRYFQPDLIIIMHGINDLYRSFSPPSWADGEYDELWTHYYGPAIEGAKPTTFERHLYEKLVDSVFYSYLTSNSWYLRLNPDISVAVDYPLETYRSLKPFAEHLQTLIRYARYDKSQVLLVTQPTIYKETMSDEENAVIWFGSILAYTPITPHHTEYPSYKSLNLAMQAFNQVVKKTAGEENLLFADAANAIPRDLEHFQDDCHFKAPGSKLLAELLAQKIIDARLIDDFSPSP